MPPLRGLLHCDDAPATVPVRTLPEKREHLISSAGRACEANNSDMPAISSAPLGETMT